MKSKFSPFMSIRTCRFETFAYSSFGKESTNWSFHGHASTFGCVRVLEILLFCAFVPITRQMGHQIFFSINLFVTNEAFENIIVGSFIEKTRQSIYRFAIWSYDFFGQQCLQFRIFRLIIACTWSWCGWNGGRRSKLICTTLLLLLWL